MIPAVLALLIGAAALFGWVTGFDWLTSWSDGTEVTMKPATATWTILSGVGVTFVTRSRQTSLLCGLIGFYIAAACLQIAFNGLADRAEYVSGLVVPQAPGIQTEAPGEPSMLTMLCFFSIGLMLSARGIAEIRPGQWDRSIPGMLGFVALAGHALDIPALYGRFQGISTAMAMPTATGIILISTSMVLQGLTDNEPKVHPTDGS